MSRSVTSSSAKRKPLAAMVPSASACTGVKVRTSLCAKDSTRPMRPSVPGCRAAASRKSSSVSDSPGHRRQHRPLPAALAQTPRHPRGPQHARGIDARHQARAARSARELALLEPGAVGRAQPHADLVVARPAFSRQGMDRLEQHLDALGRDGLGNARELGVELRRGTSAHVRAAGSAQCRLLHRARHPRRQPRMLRAVVSSAATERPIMASRSVVRRGLGLAVACGRAGAELVGELLDEVLDELDVHFRLASAAPGSAAASGASPSKRACGAGSSSK